MLDHEGLKPFRAFLRRVTKQRFFAVRAHELFSEYVSAGRPWQRKRAVQAEYGHYLVADDALVAVVHVLELPCKVGAISMFPLDELWAYRVLDHENRRHEVLDCHGVYFPASGVLELHANGELGAFAYQFLLHYVFSHPEDAHFVEVIPRRCHESGKQQHQRQVVCLVFYGNSLAKSYIRDSP